MSHCDVTKKEETDARKNRIGAEEALNLIHNAHTLIVAKGKKLTEVNLKKDRPSDEELVAMMLGPTGNLRAPTMVVGKKVLVGFNEEAFSATFKKE